MTHRVMIVKSDRLHMKMFCDLLLAQGLKTQKVEDPNGAFALLRKGGTDLVLDGIDFPDENRSGIGQIHSK